jgi:hypothetical protein
LLVAAAQRLETIPWTPVPARYSSVDGQWLFIAHNGAHGVCFNAIVRNNVACSVGTAASQY